MTDYLDYITTVGKNLQESFERLRSNPAAFAELAFSTVKDAYIIGYKSALTDCAGLFRCANKDDGAIRHYEPVEPETSQPVDPDEEYYNF